MEVELGTSTFTRQRRNCWVAVAVIIVVIVVALAVGLGVGLTQGSNTDAACSGCCGNCQAFSADEVSLGQKCDVCTKNGAAVLSGPGDDPQGVCSDNGNGNLCCIDYVGTGCTSNGATKSAVNIVIILILLLGALTVPALGWAAI
jgi:hypothetical protein